ncbi:MAG: hypothetical protein QW076_04165 [Candidatus Anstonellales archaeon]
MNAVYEYIAAITIFSLIIGFSLISVSTLSSTQLKVMYGEQLRPVAEKLLDKILLTTGSPEDWGTNIYVNDSSIKDIGLSLGSGEMYDLDVEKVQRFLSDSPLPISNITFGKLTGIYDDKGWKYGFHLRIVSALFIENLTTPFKTVNLFKFKVKTYKGDPAPNAIVTAFYLKIGILQDGSDYYFDFSSAILENITNWNGETEFNFAGNIPELPSSEKSKIYLEKNCLIVTAKYYGLQSQNIWFESQDEVLTMVAIGQYLLVNFNKADVPPFARHVAPGQKAAFCITTNLEPVVVTFEEVKQNEADYVINSGKKYSNVYRLSQPLSQEFMFVGLVVRGATTQEDGEKTRFYLVFAYRPRVPLALEYSSAFHPSAGIKTETVEKFVRIASNSYHVELTLWRMSE